jgi:type II secretory pathway component GspD/PulD (secretin)
MRSILALATALCATCAMWQVCAAEPPVPDSESPSTVVTVKPSFLPPSELITFLGLQGVGGSGPMLWSPGSGFAPVEIRRNDAANMLVLAGPAASVQAVQALIRQADVPPRQIAVEARIVEIDRVKARDAGID